MAWEVVLCKICSDQRLRKGGDKDGRATEGSNSR